MSRVSRKNPATPATPTPKLRFPEFRNAPGWEIKKLGELGSFYGGGTPSKSISEYWLGNIPWVSSSDLFDDDIHGISVTRHISQKALAESATKIVPKNSVLFVSRVGVGKLAIAKRDLCTSQDFTSFYSDEAHNYFVGYFFLAKKSSLISLGQGTSIKGFSKDDLEQYPFSYPKPEEQKKIADCLSSLDELIAAAAQKVEALRAHKKGLMQLLFPAEGQTLPQLRFPEFRNAGEWVEQAISEVCRVTQGGTPDTSNSPFWGGSVQWITPAEMGKTESKYISQTVRTITEDGLKNCSSELLPIDSIIISTRAPIGHLAINKTPMAINQGCRGLIPNSENEGRFIYYSLEKFKGQLNDLGSGNTFKELSGTALRGFKIATPKFLEQQKIADCLSSLDELIAAQAQKVEALKAHKKGLMQQLFPAVNEVQE